MATIPFRELIPILQVAIAPVILISGVGLLLLTLTNRLGRTIDRSRQLGRDIRKTGDETEHRSLAAQIEILYRRARMLRLSIIMAVLSVLLAAVLIVGLFLSALLKLELVLTVVLLFSSCLASLIVSLAAFIREVQLSLHALKLELAQTPHI